MIWNVLSKPRTSVAATVYAVVSYIFICLSIFTLVAGTTSSFQHVEIIEDDDVTYDQPKVIRSPHRSILIIDLVCLVFFTAEYTIRIVTSPRKLHFVLSFLAIVDVMALLPAYIELLAGIVTMMDLGIGRLLAVFRIIRLLTVFRILRVFRICSLLKNMQEMKNLLNTLKASVVEITFLAGLLAVEILVFATLVYFTEENNEYMNFSSITEALWWAIITMTTVGYGDSFPITLNGKIVGSLCAVSGVLMIGLTVSVLVNNAILQSKLTPTSAYTAKPSGPQPINVIADAVDRQQECAHRVPAI